MAVKKLSSNIQSLFSSAIQLSSYKRAVEELVYNALDAQSTSIAIRINIEDSKIQVVDNGCGISKEDFYLVGQKYTTSKFIDMPRYKSAPNSYGYRGLSLACLVEVSKHITISARMSNTEETWMKTFYKGKGKEPAQTTVRPSKGTTVEVKGFLYNLNIQKKSVSAMNEINDIKTLLEQLSLVHNNVSFSLRDDSKNEILFKAHKNTNIYQTLKSLFDIERSDIQELQVEKNEYKVTAYIAKSNEHPDRHHWVFLNKKFVNNTRVNKIVNDNLNKILNPTHRRGLKTKSRKPHHDEENISKDFIPFYFIFITCPYYDYENSDTPRQSTLEFKNWNQLIKLIEKLVKFYAGELKVEEIKHNNNKVEKITKERNKEDSTRERVREIMKKILGSHPKKVGVSQMQNGIKGKLIKRKKKTALKSNISKLVLLKDSTKPSKRKNNNNDKLPRKINLNERPNKVIGELMPISTKVSYNITKTRTSKKKNKIEKAITKNTMVIKKQKSDPIIEVFRKPPDVVADRCHLLAKEVENLMPLNNNKKQRFIINETVNYSNVIHNNKNISIRKRVGKIIIHDYIPLKPKERPRNAPLRDTNKNSLKTTYDLLRTIAESKERNKLELNERSQKVIPDQNEVEVPQFTYQSHHYVSNQTLSFQYEQTKTITKAENGTSNHHRQEQNLVTQIFRSQSKDKTFKQIQPFKYKINNKNIISKNTNVYQKTKAAAMQFNIRSFSDKNTSHTIEFTDSKKYSHNITGSRDSDSFTNMNRNFFTNYDTQSPPKSSAVGLTYTITSNIMSHSINDSQANFTYTLTPEKTEKLADKTNDLNVDNLNIIFISNSNKPNSEISVNNEIEPITICEAILNSADRVETNFKVSDSNGDNSFLYLTLEELSFNNINFEEIDATQHVLQSPKIQSTSHERTRSHLNNEKILENLNINIDNDAAERINIDEMVESINQSDNGKALRNKTQTAQDFDIRTRPRFLPKGMSPIFENCYVTNHNEAHLESGYFDDDLYNKFRDEVQIHTEIYESNVQHSRDIAPKNIAKVNDRLKKEHSSLTFNAESLKEAKVLGQIDNKFIAGIMRRKNDQLQFLVLLDQHAVHERIRLEENLAEYFINNEWKMVKLDDVQLKLSKDEIIYLHNYKDKLNRFGLDWTIQNNHNITLHGIPAAILGKNPKQVEKVIGAVKSLISEQIYMIRSQKGCVSLYPKSIMDLVFSEACRYAIKFGDKLSHFACVELIQALSTCKTPFQCAHGRPVMAVIMEIKPETRKYQINMGKIQQLQRLMRNKTH